VEKIVEFVLEKISVMNIPQLRTRDSRLNVWMTVQIVVTVTRITLQLGEFYMLCRGNKKYCDCKVPQINFGFVGSRREGSTQNED
jgi:hypothetical protein